ncbi:hypothetical protein C8R45DRAFT_1078336 [Mycena sanguinolenta]|nr:hypothetical protein C8R45DRAFT_1078336 [Mycena sanguinolenta]
MRGIELLWTNDDDAKLEVLRGVFHRLGSLLANFYITRGTHGQGNQSNGDLTNSILRTCNVMGKTIIEILSPAYRRRTGWRHRVRDIVRRERRSLSGREKRRRSASVTRWRGSLNIIGTAIHQSSRSIDTVFVDSHSPSITSDSSGTAFPGIALAQPTPNPAGHPQATHVDCLASLQGRTLDCHPSSSALDGNWDWQIHSGTRCTCYLTTGSSFSGGKTVPGSARQFQEAHSCDTIEALNQRILCNQDWYRVYTAIADGRSTDVYTSEPQRRRRQLRKHRASHSWGDRYGFRDAECGRPALKSARACSGSGAEERVRETKVLRTGHEPRRTGHSDVEGNRSVSVEAGRQTAMRRRPRAQRKESMRTRPRTTPRWSTKVDSLEDGNADDEAEGLVKARTFVCASGSTKEMDGGDRAMERGETTDDAYECGGVGFRAEQPGDVGGRARQGRLPRKWSRKRIIQSHQYTGRTPVKLSTILTLEDGNTEKKAVADPDVWQSACSIRSQRKKMNLKLINSNRANPCANPIIQRRKKGRRGEVLVLKHNCRFSVCLSSEASAVASLSNSLPPPPTTDGE